MIKKIRHHWISTGSNGRQNTPSGDPLLAKLSVRLIGAPDDRGVLNVGGRLGAGHAPQAIRQMLSQFMLGIDGGIGRLDLDSGIDVELGGSIEAGHGSLRSAVKADLDAGITPIVLGGGHDYGFPHVAGASDALAEKVALINVDAHLDVRPPGSDGITSGSPFFLALEEGVVKPANFVEFGIQEHCNDESFHQYVKAKGVELFMLEDARQGKGAAQKLRQLVRKFGKAGLKTVVSFDVDAVQMAHAPGVSAPQCDGFTPEEFFAMARVCGEEKDVATIGFFELAPPLDEQHRTTRLVATAIHRYLCGLSRRGEKKSTTTKKVVGVGRLLKNRIRRRR